MTTAEPRRSSPQNIPFRSLLAFNPARSVQAFLHLLPASGQHGNLHFGFAHRQPLNVDHAEEAENVLSVTLRVISLYADIQILTVFPMAAYRQRGQLVLPARSGRSTSADSCQSNSCCVLKTARTPIHCEIITRCFSLFRTICQGNQ